MNTFGAWLRTMRDRTIRGDHTMTQDEFAIELKYFYSKPSKEGSEDSKAISKSAVSTWENGTKNAPLHDNQFIEAVAQIFNVSVADVLKGAGHDLGAAYEGLDEARRRLLEAYDSGDLERLVREALAEWDKKGRSHRLDADDDGSADVTRAARR